jgi:predicted TIM-barrel fold metal-dependent hydrolase
MAASCDFLSGNRHLQQVVSREQGIYGFVTLNADYPEQSIQSQRAYLSKKEFLGAVLFQPQDGALTYNDVHEIVNAQRRYTKPLLIHTPNLEAIHGAREIAEHLPQMRIVLLTMGGDNWHAAVDVAKAHVNVNLEVSGSLDSDKIAYAANALSSRRMLFGSGLPHADPYLTMGLIEGTELLSASDRARILRQNAMALFGLEAQDE